MILGGFALFIIWKGGLSAIFGKKTPKKSRFGSIEQDNLSSRNKLNERHSAILHGLKSHGSNSTKTSDVVDEIREVDSELQKLQDMYVFPA
jgi:hypothetical protein